MLTKRTVYLGNALIKSQANIMGNSHGTKSKTRLQMQANQSSLLQA